MLNGGAALVVSNGDTWFDYTGYDASTFTEADRVASPGQAGRWAGAHTPYGYVFLSPSKRLWLWNQPNDTPIELSSNLSNALLGTVGMESISDPSTAPGTSKVRDTSVLSPLLQVLLPT